LKAAKTDIAIGKYLIAQTQIFQEEDFSFFEVSKIGPTIITLLPLNHRINFRGDSELHLAVKFGAVNFRRELSQIPPTLCVIIGKIVLKEVFMAFGKALLNHCFAGKKYGSPLSCILSAFVRTLSKRT